MSWYEIWHTHWKLRMAFILMTVGLLMMTMGQWGFHLYIFSGTGLVNYSMGAMLLTDYFIEHLRRKKQIWRDALEDKKE